MAKFWIQLDQDGVIRDILEYAYEDYKEVDVPKPLPLGIMSGYYTWDGERPVLDPARKADIDKASRPYDEIIASLQSQLEGQEARIGDVEIMLAEVVLGGGE